MSINPFDVVLFTDIISISITIVIALITGKGFFMPKHYRKPVLVRAFLALIGLITFTVGAALSSITF